jgi:hypothetical protein
MMYTAAWAFSRAVMVGVFRRSVADGGLFFSSAPAVASAAVGCAAFPALIGNFCDDGAYVANVNGVACARRGGWFCAGSRLALVASAYMPCLCAAYASPAFRLALHLFPTLRYHGWLFGARFRASEFAERHEVRQRWLAVLPTLAMAATAAFSCARLRAAALSVQFHATFQRVPRCASVAVWQHAINTCSIIPDGRRRRRER